MDSVSYYEGKTPDSECYQESDKKKQEVMLKNSIKRLEDSCFIWSTKDQKQKLTRKQLLIHNVKAIYFEKMYKIFEKEVDL